MIKTHEKKAAAAFRDYVVLLNDDHGKVRAGTYQSVVYKDKTFVAFGPHHGHTVIAEGRTCKDCHNSERVLEVRNTGKVVMTRWNADEGRVIHTTGVVPFVPDKLEFQFVTLDGDVWVPLTTKTGRFQYEFCSPLSAKQLKALGAKGT